MTKHKPVLLKEVIKGLNLKKGAVVVDATLGGGGHSIEILENIGKDGKLIAIDVDEEAIRKFSSKFEEWELGAGNVTPVKDNFANLKNILGGLGVEAVDAVLADLGYSSDQMEDAERGLSFQIDSELNMRLDRNSKLTAKDIVNNYGQNDLERIIREYGEERFAKNIARKIIEYRKNKEIETTLELVEIISSAVPERHKHRKTHFATKTFQALRIEVNQELRNLQKFIPQSIEILAPGGRLAIITFHSLEDRIVKNMFRENARGCICPPSFPKCVCGREAKVHPFKSPAKGGGAAKPQFNRVKIITRKPIGASVQEIKENPRARSAKLRICEKI